MIVFIIIIIFIIIIMKQSNCFLFLQRNYQSLIVNFALNLQVPDKNLVP